MASRCALAVYVGRMRGIRVRVDELDLALITALQVAPRASWARLAGPLGVDAATLSRRWSGLRESGTAWLTCYPGSGFAAVGVLAFVQVDCEPSEVAVVAAALAALPAVVSVELVAGAHPLLLTVGSASAALFTEQLLAFGRVPGVRGLRTHPVRRLHREGSRWRFDALSPGQQRELAADTAPGADSPAPLSAEERALILALGADGRRTVAALAAELDRPEATVRRLLGKVLGGGRAVLRCEAALPVTGWRTTATLWLNMPAAERVPVMEAIEGLRDTRLCAATVTDADAIAVTCFRGLDGLADYEARLGAVAPGLRVIDRVVTLRWVKRMGRLLGEDGRATGYVPMDVWAAPT